MAEGAARPPTFVALAIVGTGAHAKRWFPKSFNRGQGGYDMGMVVDAITACITVGSAAMCPAFKHRPRAFDSRVRKRSAGHDSGELRA